MAKPNNSLVPKLIEEVRGYGIICENFLSLNSGDKTSGTETDDKLLKDFQTAKARVELLSEMVLGDEK